MKKVKIVLSALCAIVWFILGVIYASNREYGFATFYALAGFLALNMLRRDIRHEEE